jgi:hypothetical protein
VSLKQHRYTSLLTENQSAENVIIIVFVPNKNSKTPTDTSLTIDKMGHVIIISLIMSNMH